jgi:hypothetical protein
MEPLERKLDDTARTLREVEWTINRLCDHTRWRNLFSHIEPFSESYRAFQGLVAPRPGAPKVIAHLPVAYEVIAAPEPAPVPEAIAQAPEVIAQAPVGPEVIVVPQVPVIEEVNTLKFNKTDLLCGLGFAGIASAWVVYWVGSCSKYGRGGSRRK